jgi:hypothetical protein
MELLDPGQVRSACGVLVDRHSIWLAALQRQDGGYAQTKNT